MPKEQYQIMMRKLCIVIRSLLSWRPNHHSGYTKDREKHHTLLTLKRTQNLFHDVYNVEGHELFGFDASRPLTDVIPKRANTLAVVEGVLSRFFQAPAAARTHLPGSLEVPAEKGQRVPCKPPGERELGVVQETRTWHPIPVRADLPRRPPVTFLERLQSGAHH